MASARWCRMSPSPISTTSSTTSPTSRAARRWSSRWPARVARWANATCRPSPPCRRTTRAKASRCCSSRPRRPIRRMRSAPRCKDAGLTAPCIPDPTGTLSKMLGALASTDVFVLDARRTLVYRGAFDDQYGLGYSLDAPRHRYAVDALDAVLAGRTPAIAATEAPGCVLDLGSAQPVELDGRRHLSQPHLPPHPGELPGMPSRRRRRALSASRPTSRSSRRPGMIRRMVERGLMPPWFAKPEENGAHSPWMNDRTLSETDRADLVSRGFPTANPSATPRTPRSRAPGPASGRSANPMPFSRSPIPST